jgi:hypothetical protein
MEMQGAAVILLVSAGVDAWAAEAALSAKRVDVCLSSGPAFQIAYGARRQAADVFAAVGVQIHWLAPDSCRNLRDSIRITIVAQAPEQEEAGALARAFPYEGVHINIYYDRVKEQCRCAQQLLAYVLVHEITHVLQGISRHSETGIMKPRWSSADYFAMQHHAIGFEAVDVALIRDGIDSRGARLAAYR